MTDRELDRRAAHRLPVIRHAQEVTGNVIKTWLAALGAGGGRHQDRVLPVGAAPPLGRPDRGTPRDQDREGGPRPPDPRPRLLCLGPARLGDIQHSQADISLAQQALGYEARVPLGEGIARTLEWFRDPAPAKRVSNS